ncbi:hypothetical protein [Thiomicrorhabdus sp.]|uniref:hypothetical protein n=1 Tax=Thiomicrorhabdus sp. TaxID=2039724 RepID=UPI0029C7666A|nr:hypothetical protein [Thiomicrorhabdus sp.]
MSTQNDDLLEQLQQLEPVETEKSIESSPQEKLEELGENLQQQQSNIQNLHEIQQGALLEAALQSAQIAQETARHGQDAAESVIKLAEKLNSEIYELQEANRFWKQSTHKTQDELKAVHKRSAWMLTSGIIFSLMSLGAMGYLLYDSHHSNAQLKGEVLDIVQTEQRLLQNKVTMKMDELASTIELLSYQIQQKPLPIKNEVTASEAENTAAHTPEPIAEPESASPVAAAAGTLPQDQASQEQIMLAWQTRLQAELKPLQQKIDTVIGDLKTLAKRQGESKAVLTAQSIKIDDKQWREIDAIEKRLRLQSSAIQSLRNRIDSISFKPLENQQQRLQAQQKTLQQQLEVIALQQRALKRQIEKVDQNLEEILRKNAAVAPYSYKAPQ